MHDKPRTISGIQLGQEVHMAWFSKGPLLGSPHTCVW